ncbi:hypothetical protein ACOMHN_040160 [Nucella lapillus]
MLPRRAWLCHCGAERGRSFSELDSRLPNSMRPCEGGSAISVCRMTGTILVCRMTGTMSVCRMTGTMSVCRIDGHYVSVPH